MIYRRVAIGLLAASIVSAAVLAQQQTLNRPPQGYTALFDGKTLDG